MGPDPFLALAVDIRIEGDAELLRRRDEDACERMRRRHVRDAERPAIAVVFARAEGIGLHALEVGQHVAVAPRAGVADEAGPLVIVLVLAPDVDHAVDRARAAEHLAARPHGVAPVERGVGLAHVHPVEAGIEDRLDLAGGNAQHRRGVEAAAFEQQDLVLRVGGKPVCKHAPGRACADDDVVPRHPSLPMPFFAHGSRPPAGASARAPQERRAAVAACHEPVQDGLAPVSPVGEVRAKSRDCGGNGACPRAFRP